MNKQKTETYAVSVFCLLSAFSAFFPRARFLTAVGALVSAGDFSAGSTGTAVGALVSAGDFSAGSTGAGLAAFLALRRAVFFFGASSSCGSSTGLGWVVLPSVPVSDHLFSPPSALRAYAARFDLLHPRNASPACPVIGFPPLSHHTEVAIWL